MVKLTKVPTIKEIRNFAKQDGVIFTCHGTKIFVKARLTNNGYVYDFSIMYLSGDYKSFEVESPEHFKKVYEHVTSKLVYVSVWGKENYKICKVVKETAKYFYVMIGKNTSVFNKVDGFPKGINIYSPNRPNKIIRIKEII